MTAPAGTGIALQPSTAVHDDVLLYAFAPGSRVLVGLVDRRLGRPALPAGSATCSCADCQAEKPAIPTRFQAMWCRRPDGLGGLSAGGPFRETPAEAEADLRAGLAAAGWTVAP